MTFDSNLKSSNIIFAKHKDDKLINDIKINIQNIFAKKTSYYSNLDVDVYRKLVKDAQEILNKKNFCRKIVENIKKDIQTFIEEEKFYIQTNLYLRASRPFVQSNSENIDWHRESFYGANMEQSVNIWTPIMNVNESNTLRYIISSQKIREQEIEIQQIDDPFTKKGSYGHTLGFQYSPKKIISGVDLNNDAPMNVPNYHSSIFPGNLIHGAAKNNSNKIRFSIDFRILPLRYYNPDLSKKFHFASGKPYFELY